MLDYDYIKNHYKLIASDLSWQKIDTDPKATQQTEFTQQLKNLDNIGNAADAGNNQTMFVLMILENSNKRSKFPQGSVTV